MTAEHLLKIAELLCGPEARRQVFEPLVADWAREYTDTRALSRTRAFFSGAVAFCWSLLRCVNPTCLVAAAPWSGYLAFLMVFAAAGAALALQPLQYTWIGAGVRFLWVTPPEGLAYFVPKALAYMAAFALLPVVLLATAAGWRWLRLLAGVSVTLVAIFLVEGWLAPAAMRTRDGRLGKSAQEISSLLEVRLYANTAEVFVLASSSDRRLAAAAKHELLLKAQGIALSVSFALLGFALGRARFGPLRNPSMLVLAACWFGEWLTHQVVDYWGQYLVALLWLAATAPWFGPVVFGSAALVVMLSTRGGCPEAPFREAQPSGPPRTL
jgi:MFS family permease